MGDVSWKAEIDRERGLAVREAKGDKPKQVFPVVKTTIWLHRGDQALAFKVGKGTGGHPVITDVREQMTGSAPLTLRGPLPGEAYTKPGPVRKLTATAWVKEVSRLIGEARAREIVSQL